MSKRFSTRLLLSSALVALSTPAIADINAPDLWAEWQAFYSDMGMSITVGSEAYSGGTLTLSDVAFVYNHEVNFEDFKSVTADIRLSSLVFEEVDNDTIDLQLPRSVPINAQVVMMDGTRGIGILTQTFDSGQWRITDMDADARQYQFTANSSKMDLQELIVDGESMPATFQVEMTDADSTYVVAPGDTRTEIAVTGGSALGTVLFDFNDGDGIKMFTDYVIEGNKTDVKIGYNRDVTIAGDTILALAPSLEGTFSVDATRTLQRTTTPLGEDESVSSSGKNTGSVRFNTSELFVESRVDDTKVTATNPLMPAPIDLSVGLGTFALAMPLGKGMNAPFQLALDMADVELGEDLWAMFDPGQQLPRTPARFALDLTGTMDVKVDLLDDPAQFETMESSPIIPKTLSIEGLNLALAGALLTGSGSGAFNTDMMEFGGPPIPFGKLALQLDGGFALVDSLVAMGMLPAMEAAGIKGMAGAFANKTGDDRLEATLESTRQGGIAINGIPLQ